MKYITPPKSRIQNIHVIKIIKIKKECKNNENAYQIARKAKEIKESGADLDFCKGNISKLLIQVKKY